MEIKTRSGICITVDNSTPSKVLLFDKPVRAVELTQEESLQVGAMLTAKNILCKKDVLLKNNEIHKVDTNSKITELKVTGTN